jgi:hypothetical protein
VVLDRQAVLVVQQLIILAVVVAMHQTEAHPQAVLAVAVQAQALQETVRQEQLIQAAAVVLAVQAVQAVQVL